MNYMNEKGNSLLITILIVVLISIIGLSLLTKTANSNKITVSERYDQSIYYIAEAGLNLEKTKLVSILNKAYAATVTKLEKTPVANIPSFNFTTVFTDELCHLASNYCTASPTEYRNFTKQFNKQPIASTSVIKTCTNTKEMNCSFKIIAKGYLQEEQTKTRDLVQTITITSEKINVDDLVDEVTEQTNNPPGNAGNSLPIQNAVAISGGKVKISGNAEIKGNIASNTNKFELSGNYKHTGIFPTVTTPINLANYLPPFISHAFPPKNQGTKLSQLSLKDVYIESLKGSQTIDVGTENRTLYISDLVLNKGTITIKGTGTLTIIINENVDLKGSIVRTDGDATKLNIFYQGNKKIKTEPETTITGSIHVLKGDLDVAGGSISGNYYYHGTEKLNINGNGNSEANYFVAPYAEVQANGSAIFKGVILAKEIQINGNNTLIYAANTLVPLPNPNPTPTPPTTPTQPIIIDGDFSIIESDIEEQ